MRQCLPPVSTSAQICPLREWEVCVCGARRWCCSSPTRPFALDEPQSCPQEKGSRSPCLKRASQAWPLIMYSPSPYNWKGPLGASSTSNREDKKKNTKHICIWFDYPSWLIHGPVSFCLGAVWKSRGLDNICTHFGHEVQGLWEKCKWKTLLSALVLPQ